MPEKYIYKDKVLKRKEVEDAAKQSGMDIDTYTQKAGLKRVNDNYNFNGKTVPAEEIFQAASESKLGFDDYIQKAKIIPIEDSKKKVGSVVVGENYSSPELDSEAQSSSEIPTVELTDTQVGIDPVSISKQYKELNSATKQVYNPSSGKGGQLITTVPDEDAKESASVMRADMERKGYDLDKISKDFDFPDYVYNALPKEKLLDDYLNNKPLYEREIATAKWQSSLLDNLRKEGNEQVFNGVLQAIDNVTNKDNPLDPVTKRKNIQDVVKVINQYGGEKKDEMLRNLSTDLSNEYAKEAVDYKHLADDPLTKNLNPVQVSAYHLMEDISPDQLNKYKAAFIDDKDIKDNYEAKLQKQEALKRLDEMGIQMQKSYANEHLAPLMKEYNDLYETGQVVRELTPEERQRMLAIEQEANPFAEVLHKAEDKESELTKDYPIASRLAANSFAQELVGQKHSGLDWMAIEMGKATDNTARGLWDFAKHPFLSDTENEINQAEILGNAKLNENVAHLNQSNQTQKTFKPTLSKELQADVDAIKNDSKLSGREKTEKVTDLLMNRTGEWQRTPESKTNVGITSLLYGVGGLAANLAPFMAAEMVTGGGASAGVVRKFTSAFTSAAATGFEDSYAQALEKGSDNPFADAMRVTAINSAAMAGAGTPDAIRAMLGNKTAIGKLVNSMTDDAIKTALKSEPKALSTFRKAYEGFKGVVKNVPNAAMQGAKSGAKLSAFTTGGQIANDAIDGELKAPEDYLKQAAIETLKFTILGTAGGTLGKIGQKPSDVSLAAITEAARNPEAFTRSLDVMEKNGDISPTGAAQVRNNIEKASKIFKSPIINHLSEKDKRDYMYNGLVKIEAKEAAANLPPKQAEKAEHTALVADYANELILEPKTDKQLQSRLTQIEKELPPEKNHDGTTVPINEKLKKDLVAEKEAIGAVIEKRESFDKQVKLQSKNLQEKKGNPEEISQPIELSVETPVDNTETLIQDFKEKNPLYKDAPNEELLKSISEQSQNIAGGKLNETMSPETMYEQAVKQYGSKELVDAAIAKYPKEKLLNEKTENNIPLEAVVKEPTDAEPNKESSGTEETKGTETKELDKLASNIPNGGEVKKYLSGDTIKKYEEGAELRNDQEITAQELEPALRHGVETIEKAKEIFGDKYIEKTLDYIEREKLNPENKALLYVSLENDMAKRILEEPDNAGLKKLQDLVRTKSQAYLRSNSLAINMGRLRKFAEVGYDISKVTDKFFSSKELEQKGAVEKLVQADADTINEAAALKEAEAGFTPEVEQKIKEGVEKEINAIYEKLPSNRKKAADKAIKTLDNIQKKLRSKTYDASLGIPVAIIDAGITTIKNAIKVGVNIADAIELGINKIKEKYGKTWDKEKEFRDDMLKGFKEISDAELDPKKYVKSALIEQGYGKEITVTTKDGKEKRKIIDWKKLAGEEGSVDRISENVAKALKKDVDAGKLTEEQVKEVKDEFIDEYNELRASVIEKGLNEMAARNKTTVTPAQKSAAKKLAEMYNYGLFDKDPIEYENTLSKTIGIDRLKDGRAQKVKELGQAMASLYSSDYQGKRLTESQMRTAIQVVEERMRELLHAEANKHGSTPLFLADMVRTYMDAAQRMTLNNLKQALENPLSGLWESLYSTIGYSKSSSGKLSSQQLKSAAKLYKEMVDQKGVGYGNVSTTFVNKGNLEMQVNKLSNNKWFHRVASTLLGRTTLDAVDSFYKSKITQQKFVHNLVQVLTKDRLINGKVEKGMSKEDAKKYVAEKLIGQSFKDAQSTAKKIIDKANEGKSKKIFNDSPEFVDRLANDIVTAALVNGEKITEEMVTASYNAAYKAAGRGLGHVANNFISQAIGTTTGKIESRINDAIKEKEYNKAAALTMQSILYRNIANPFVGGGTNWVVLKAEKSGLGLLSGLGSMMEGGRKMDLTSEAGIKKLEQAMYQNLKVKDKFIRGAVGGMVTALSALAFAGITSTDEYRKWRSKNMWAARYLDTLTPEVILGAMAVKDDKTKRYIESTLNQNDQFDKTKKLIEGSVAAVKGDTETAKGKFGEVAGGIVGAPIPWRLVRDGQQILQGVSGDEVYKVDNRPSQSVMEGYFKGGLFDYLGFAPDGKYVGNDLSQPEFKFLKEKKAQIVPYNRHSLNPLDSKGNPIEVTEEKYKQFLEKREEYIKKDVRDLMAGKKHILAGTETVEDEDGNASDKQKWSILTQDEVDKITTDELKGFVMTATTRANEKAIHDVFGGRGNEPKSSGKRKIE